MMVLIVPPIPFLRDQKRNAPLGVMYLAAALERAGKPVAIADLRGVPEEKWMGTIPEGDIYGMGETSIGYLNAVEVARKLKAQRRAPIVLGGVHASVTPVSEIDDCFDCVVQGEGDLTIVDLVSDFERGALQKLYRSQRVQDLDSLPLPARHLMSYESLVNTEIVERGQPATTIITSRGCPWDCAFCANEKIYGRIVRYHSAKHVVEEIQWIINTLGVRQFRFHDDTMTVNKRRLREMADALGPMGIKFRCNGRVNEIDPEILALLKTMGCDEIGYGVETPTQAALDMVHKKAKVEDAVRAIRLTREAGIKTRIFLIFGLPGDYGDVSQRFIDFLKLTKPDGVDVSTLSPFPGSEIHDHPEQFGLRIKTQQLDKYRMIFGLDDDECEEDFVFEYDGMSNEELKQHRRRLLEFIRDSEMEANR